MQKTKNNSGLNTGMKFVISCGYFNNEDEITHTTDFIVDLIQDKPVSLGDNPTPMVTAA